MKTLLSMVLCLCHLSLFADVFFSTGPTTAPRGQTSELGGSITTLLIGDDFASATPENPIYQRINFTDTTLAHTVVGEGDDPIYLPLVLNSEAGELVAPADTVSIVRWVAGEAYIWIRFQRSSSTWIRIGEEFQAPDDNNRIVYHLGLSASRSAEKLDEFEKKNLPFPTHNLEATREDTHLARSILHCLNISNATETYINLDAFHFSDLNSENSVQIHTNAGAEVIVQFTYDCQGVTNSETVNIDGQTVANQLAIQAACSFQSSIPIYEDSYLDVSVSEDASYGFQDSSLRFENESDGMFEVDQDSAFSLDGQTLYRRGRLHYSGNAFQIYSNPINILAELAVSEATEVLVDYDFVVYITPNPQDEAPFDGDQQHRYCARTSVTLSSGQWRMATTQNAVAVPHLTSADGGFVTELIFNNSSDQEQTVTAQAYTGTGSESTTTQVNLLAGETKKVSAQTLFQDDSAAHCRLIADDGVQTVVQYQLDTSNSGPAHGKVSTQSSKTWTFFGGNQSRTWDGFAIVNQGALQTNVQCSQYASDGSLIATQEIATNLAPNQKVLGLITEYFEWVDGAKYVIEAAQELSIIALRGDHSSLFLWQNAVIPQ